ncbi:MAG: type II toxin-antitoxin system VapC family toxin [bacterium]
MLKEINRSSVLTIDSSVIISYLMKTENGSKEAERIWMKVLKEEVKCIEPMTVLVEVASAIQRRTGNSELANTIINELLQLKNITYVDFTKSRALKAMDISLRFGVRGMDSIFIQVSEEFNTKLITFDNDIINRVGLN